MRMLIAGILGGVILMAWSFAAWMLLPLHDSLGALPQETVVMAALREADLESGAYAFPYMPEDDAAATPEERDAAYTAWEERHREGPVGYLFYDADGADPMAPMLFGQGLLIDVVSALLAAALLSMAGLRSFITRVVFVLGLAFLIILASDLTYWNWMGFPTDYTVANIVDRVVGWFLASLVLAALVKPKPA